MKIIHSVARTVDLPEAVAEGQRQLYKASVESMAQPAPAKPAIRFDEGNGSYWLTHDVEGDNLSPGRRYWTAHHGEPSLIEPRLFGFYTATLDEVRDRVMRKPKPTYEELEAMLCRLVEQVACDPQAHRSEAMADAARMVQTIRIAKRKEAGAMKEFDYTKRRRMSPDLRRYLARYLDWVEQGAPDGEPFNRCYGLCSNAAIHTLYKTTLERELERVFGKAGAYPFGMDDYYKRSLYSYQHTCPKRLAFVRANLPARDPRRKEA